LLQIFSATMSFLMIWQIFRLTWPQRITAGLLLAQLTHHRQPEQPSGMIDADPYLRAGEAIAWYECLTYAKALDPRQPE
jgi:hypothetical protein